MINAQERAKLRSFGSMLKDLVFIGKDGLTDNVIAQINDNLFAHELIKVKVQKNTPEDIKVLSANICKSCNCEVVSVIGSKILLYKVTDKPKFQHILYKYFNSLVLLKLSK